MTKRAMKLFSIVVILSLLGSMFVYAAPKGNSNMKAVTVKWTDPADITYGKPLDSSELNAIATYNGTRVSGKYVYSPGAGTLLEVGNGQILNVTFTPDNTKAFGTATKSVKINVLEPAPIEPATPADTTTPTTPTAPADTTTPTTPTAPAETTTPTTPTDTTTPTTPTNPTTPTTPADTTTPTTPADTTTPTNPADTTTPTTPTVPAIPTDGKNVKDYGALGDGITDDTAAIQKAINDLYTKGGGSIYIPDGTYMINPDISIRMKSNIKLHLSENAVLKAKPSSNTGYYVILMYDISNAEVTGGKIFGERNQHIGTTGQWGHGIAIRGCNNIHVADVSVSDCWGDGIYIGSTDKQFYSSNVVVERYNLNNNRRQGISVISAKNVLLKDGIISNTNGTDPQRGIDFEPNNANEFMQDVVVENLRTYNNAGYGIGFWLLEIEGTTNEVSITIKNYVDSGSRAPFNGQLRSNPFVTNNVTIL